MKTIKNNNWYGCVIYKRFYEYIRSRVLAIGMLLVCVSFLSACAQSSQSNEEKKSGDKHIHFLYNFSTNSLDPHVDSSYVPLRAGLTETLVRLDEENLTIAPWLAESWEGEDGQHWTIKLREDVTFQNGKKMLLDH